jgi:hypothetical protein
VSSLYSTLDLSRVCALVVDGLTECGKSWIAAHPASRGYGEIAAGWFVAPYFDLAQGFTETSEPQYQPFQNLSRTEPALMFNGVNNRMVTVVFHLMAEDAQYNMQALKEAVAWLSDLNQPSYSASGTRYAPPKLQVLIGNVFRMTCITEQVSIRYVGPWSNNPSGEAYPHGIDVSLSFCAVPEAFQNYAGGANGERPYRRTEAYSG